MANQSDLNGRMLYFVRSFEEKDRTIVRQICRSTGLRGRPTMLFFEDEELAPRLFADYYLDHEPESCFVAEADGAIVGYLLGCKDSRRYFRVLAWKIVPRILFRVLAKFFTFQYRRRQTYQTLWWLLSRSWRETLVPPIKQYPAHAHLNVEEAFRGRGIGRELSRIFHEHARRQGIKGLYAVELEEEGDDRLSAFLCRERGYRILRERRHTVWEKATGKRWIAKLMVCELEQEEVAK